MERLTQKGISVQGVYKTCCVNFRNQECKILEGDCTRCSANDKVWDRLAEYEDTGLSPEEIIELQDKLKTARGMLHDPPGLYF